MIERRKKVWTEERVEFLRECVKGHTEVESLRLFRERYPETSMSSMVNAKVKFHISSGIKGGQFQKGHVPANKGKKGIHLSPATEFSKGNQPMNTRKLGDIKKDAKGYYYIKVSMTGKACEKWTSMNIYTWEQTTGEKVDRQKEVVCFLDGNRANWKFENLMKVPRAIHSIMCHRHWYTNDAEKTRAYVNIAILQHQQHFLMRKHKLGAYKYPSQQSNAKSFREYQEECMKNHTVSETGMGVSENS